MQEALGLKVGGTYALDLYNAERHTAGSNFGLMTSLSPGCGVLLSATAGYTWSPATISTDWKLVGGPTWAIDNNGSILLTSASAFDTVGYAYLNVEANVGTGFIATFNFTTTANTGEGFVFNLRRDGITNLNGGTGGNLGFSNTVNGLGVAFDFCANRESVPPQACQGQIRAQYSNTAGAVSALNASTVLFAPLYHPNQWNDGQAHSVIVRYLYNAPAWLQVYVDEDLFLMQRSSFNLTTILGGSNAYVGFSASTGDSRASNTTIADFNLQTVGIDDAKTQPVNWPESGPLNATSDGYHSVSFAVQTFDLCNNSIQFGKFGSVAAAYLLPVSANATSQSATESAFVYVPNGTFVASSGSGALQATVIDNNDGVYLFSFTSTTPGTYALVAWYGSACYQWGYPLASPPAACFTSFLADAAVFSPLPPTAAPTIDDGSGGVAPAVFTGIGVGIGIISCAGLVLIGLGVRMRNQWRRDKVFIEAGRLAAMEKGIDYLRDDQLGELQHKLQQTLEDLNRERAKRRGSMGADHVKFIQELMRQKGELQEQVRMLKIRAQGGDPYAPVQPESFVRRVRMSVSARPSMSVSRGAGGRQSRVLSMSLAGLFSGHRPSSVADDGVFATDNPAFRPGLASRLSRAFRGSVSDPFGRGVRGSAPKPARSNTVEVGMVDEAGVPPPPPPLPTF